MFYLDHFRTKFSWKNSPFLFSRFLVPTLMGLALYLGWRNKDRYGGWTYLQFVKVAVILRGMFISFNEDF